MPELVFVYGTLQREFGNHRVMEYAGGEFVGNAQTMDKYPLIVEGLVESAFPKLKMFALSSNCLFTNLGNV